MPINSYSYTAGIPGTYVIEDDGVPGNNFSRIRAPDGSVTVFEHPTIDFLITASTPGITLVFNLTDPFATASVTVGSLTDPTQSPDAIVVQSLLTSAQTGTVTLAATGSITESSDADGAADIIALRLAMSAGTGIGTAGNALETLVSQIEAETNSGGIAIVNLNSITIGGFTNDIDGLDVFNSGDINLTAFGTILIGETSGGGIVTGGATSGNINLTALGFDSDIIASNNAPSIFANRGNIVLTAGRDISFGLGGADFNNDVLADGSITINAGRDFLLSGFADVISDAVTGNTGGGIVVNAGRNISVLDDTGTNATLAASGTAGADIVLTTGSGGTLTLEAPSTALRSNSGDIIVNADVIVIAAAGGIAASAGTVTLAPVTVGRPINLGSPSATSLSLVDSELDRISTPNLILGSNNAGSVTVSAPISPVNAPNVTIRSGGDINVQANVITGASLSLRALDDIFLTSGTILTGTLTAFVDAVDDDPGVGDTATLNGSITATSITVTGNADADTLNGGGANETLLGLGGNDSLRGFGGADTLDGGAGDDTMHGGLGNDIYFVDSVGDVVTEAVGEGIDEVRTALGSRSNFALLYTLPANVENLTGTSAGAQGVVGNALDNVINMGNAGDLIVLHDGGNDTVTGGGGNDFIYYGATFTSIGDSNDGGAGFDTVGLLGTYNITFGTNDLVSIEKLALYSAGDPMVSVPNNYTITMTDANVASGATMMVVALSLHSTETFVFNGAAETNGIFNIRGGMGNDTITAGAGNDQVFGNLGADNLRGGAGNDFFEYYAANHSTAAAMDQILDFTLGDRINLFQIDADGNGANGNSSFAFIGSGAFTNTAGQVRAYQSGPPGSWFVEADVNGDSIADLVIALTVIGGHTLTAADFIL
jgi:hypothetical protein